MGGWGGWGGGGGGSSADSTSTLLTLRTVYVYCCTKCTHSKLRWTFCYAPTTNGSTGITGPQQTNGSSLIILYLICGYAKCSLLNN